MWPGISGTLPQKVDHITGMADIGAMSIDSYMDTAWDISTVIQSHGDNQGVCTEMEGADQDNRLIVDMCQMEA